MLSSEPDMVQECIPYGRIGGVDHTAIQCIIITETELEEIPQNSAGICLDEIQEIEKS